MFSGRHYLHRMRQANAAAIAKASAQHAESGQPPAPGSASPIANRPRRRTQKVVRKARPPHARSISLPSHAAALAHAKERLELALKHGHAPRTATSYCYAVKRYLKFTASLGYSERDSLPASEELLLLFIAEGLGAQALTTPKTTSRHSEPGTSRTIILGLAPLSSASSAKRCEPSGHARRKSARSGLQSRHT